MTTLFEICTICIALLVSWMAYYAAEESGWLWVYIEDLDIIYCIGGWMTLSAAICQLPKGVLT
jgi:hypothetical protein